MPVALAGGYLLGTFPSADLVARRSARRAGARGRDGGATDGRSDLRHLGSGNPGALNAYRSLGRRAGALVLVADVAKGMLAGGAGLALAGPGAAQVAVVAAIVGHCFPLWTGLRGGKGVATAAGGILALFPAAFGVSFAAGLLAVGATRRAVVGMQAAVVGWLAASLWWWAAGWPNPWGPAPGPGLVATAATSAIVVVGAFARARPPVRDPGPG